MKHLACLKLYKGDGLTEHFDQMNGGCLTNISALRIDAETENQKKCLGTDEDNIEPSLLTLCGDTEPPILVHHQREACGENQWRHERPNQLSPSWKRWVGSWFHK